jgi:hypothetical protein
LQILRLRENLLDEEGNQESCQEGHQKGPGKEEEVTFLPR